MKSKQGWASSPFRFWNEIRNRWSLTPLIYVFVRADIRRTMRYLDKENGVKNILKLALIALLLFCTCPCWALSKGALTDKEINYFLTVFNPILIKAHICTQVRGDCEKGYVICGSNETLDCTIYGITDAKVIRELFMSMLNSGLNVSSFTFYRSKYHEGSFFEKPLLEFIDRTGDK